MFRERTAPLKGSSAAQLDLESVFSGKEFQRIQPKKLQMIGNFPVKNRAFPHIVSHLTGSKQTTFRNFGETTLRSDGPCH
jgi:hypothetical protein